MTGESISERESKRFEEGLNAKVKLSLYKNFGKGIEFKKCLHGVADAGSRLLFKFRSGTHGLNEEWGRHSGREGNKECGLCGNECERVSHVLWECLIYSSSRADFLLKLQEKLGNEFECFDLLDSLGKLCFILSSELWEDHFDSLLALFKDYVVKIWEVRKLKFYGDDSSQFQSSTGDLGDVAGFEGHSGVGMCQGGEPDTDYSICMNVCCSACENACVVDGTCATAAN